MAMKRNTTGEMIIEPPQFHDLTFYVVGESPLILNTMSAKAKMELLMPKRKSGNKADRAKLKHDPVQEFRDSALQLTDESAPTLLALPATAFKGAVRTAALDTPGTSKSQVGRLVYVVGEHVPIFGVPQIYLSVTRMADMKRTPDVKSRAIVPQWAARFVMRYSIIKAPPLVTLVHTSGVTCGVGDFRPEKGAGSFGRFRIANAEDIEFQRIMKNGGRAAQIAAMANPMPYDRDTSMLLEWFGQQVTLRGEEAAA